MFEDYISALQKVPLSEAIPGGAGTTPEGSPTAFSGALNGVMNMPKHLVEAAREAPVGVPPSDMTPEQKAAYGNLIGASTDTALGLAGIGAPVAEVGAAGIFGGKLAKTADIEKLIFANKAKEAGKDMPYIMNNTGWFQSPTDKKWRFEIPDDKARMMGHGLDYTKDGNMVAGPAQVMMQHPELWKAYPQLMDKKLGNTVYQNPKNGIGTGSFTKDLIEVNAPTINKATNVGLHELQHGVQEIENFAPGSNPGWMAYLKEKKPQNIPSFEHSSDPNDMYHRLAGEVESRNVQLRHLYTPDERKMIHPWDSHEVRYRDQLVLNPTRDIVKALRN